VPETVEQEDDESTPMKENKAVQTDLRRDQIDEMVATISEQQQALGRFFLEIFLNSIIFTLIYSYKAVDERYGPANIDQGTSSSASSPASWQA
jgi:hypothetical protein